MTSIALKMVTDVAMGMWASNAISTLLLNGDAVGYGSRAIQSGGMGLILTMLLLTVPPMAANFFQGSLGQFMAYATIGPHLSQGQPQRGSYSGGGPGGEYPQQLSAANTSGSRDQVSSGEFRTPPAPYQQQPLAGQPVSGDSIRRDAPPHDRG
ncbi:hypothetical protein [Marilutibacter alkalisoli]|uniref:Type IV secretion system protein VirB6 n=1 Tax=Marilutibacter alkalisoli TaxID=2591633 RepID=A0A514BWH7_9GAMM|nr:hypothetical protein [Lysobacter alkalisoli]QDH71349.1 hypothetical protein FKV23_15575 [Lysobacter alkalisoli]